MNISEPVTGPVPVNASHKNKADRICSVMRECCSGMSATDKRSMMHDVMPRMMETMGDDSMSGMMRTMMRHCMRSFRWFPLIPLGFGVIFFLLGYFLSAEAVRVLWLVLATIPIILGVLGLLLTNAMMR